jgi:hypothetical protein
MGHLNLSITVLLETNFLDDINVFFWIIFGVLAVIGLITRLINASSKPRGASSSGMDLMTYLQHRIEKAGIQNNVFKNDPLMAPMGFMGAIKEEKELLKSQARTIAHQFQTDYYSVLENIDRAHTFIYRKYIE